jgi:carbamoyltransferase
VLAGGVALTSGANGRLLRERVFENVWIQPAAGDAGGALGSALLVAHEYFDAPRTVNPRDGQKGSYLGPQFSNAEIRAFLDYYGYPYHELSDDARARETARLVSEKKIVGYMVGRMEFGPRSLGARAILGDPRDPETQSSMNLKIKHRESFRPFAPSVVAERAGEYFELDRESPYMLLVAPVREARRVSEASQQRTDDDDMLRVVNRQRSDIPAVTHVDYSARVQTVNAQDKPDYHSVLREFERLTGYGVMVNTSFNVRGEPIVCTPEDAYRCFMRTEIDALVLENFLLLKSEQPEFEDSVDWRGEYEMD